MVAEFRTFWLDESGSTAIEYALLAALVSVASLGAFGAIETATATVFNAVAAELAMPS